MKDVLIRDVPDEIVAALSEKARAANMDRQDWLRDLLKEVASEPLIKSRYILKAFGPGAAFVVIRRVEDSMSHDGERGLPEEQKQALYLAIEFVKRNGPGDRESAIAQLKSKFEHVFETVI